MPRKIERNLGNLRTRETKRKLSFFGHWSKKKEIILAKKTQFLCQKKKKKERNFG
jgi:hypothetical protein